MSTSSTRELTASWSATMSSMSPFDAPHADASAASASSSKKRATGERTEPSSSYTIQTRPPAPLSFASASSASAPRRGVSAPPGTAKPRTRPPASMARRNTMNSLSRTMSVRSLISMPKRRSGLSEP